MAISVVQTAANGAAVSTTPHTTTASSAFTVGNILVVATSSQGGAPGCTPSGGGVTTWTKADGHADANGTAEIWYGKVTSGGVTTVSIATNNSSNSFPAGNVFELAGVDSTSPVLTSGNGVISNSATVAYPSLSATAAGQFYVGTAFPGNGVPTGNSPTAGFSAILSDDTGGNSFDPTVYQVTTGAGTLAPTIAGASSMLGDTVAAIFQAAAGGPNPAAPLPFPPFSAPFIEPNVIPFQQQGDAYAPFLNLTDTGAGSDAVTVSAAVPLSDTGTGSDSISVGVAVPLADTGTGDDSSFTVAVAVPLTDTGAGADSISVNQGADPNQAPALQFPPWTAPFIEPNAVPFQLLGDSSSIPQISLSDTGAAADGLTVTAAVPLVDTAAAADAVTIAAAVPLADSGSGADAATVTAAVPLTDSGTAADSITVVSTGAADSAPFLVLLIPSPLPFSDPTFVPFQLQGTLGAPSSVSPARVTSGDQALVTVSASSSAATITAGDAPAAIVTSSSN